LQVGKSELLEVAPVHFLAELGVVPQTSNAKTDRTNRLKADLFYKLNKWVVVSWLYTHDLQHPPALSQLVGLLGIVCIVSCCPKLLEPPVHLLSVFAGGTTFDISLFRVDSGFRSFARI